MAALEGDEAFPDPPVSKGSSVGLGCFLGETIRRNAARKAPGFPPRIGGRAAGRGRGLCPGPRRQGPSLPQGRPAGVPGFLRGLRAGATRQGWLEIAQGRAGTARSAQA
jgi:hypothetical protein